MTVASDWLRAKMMVVSSTRELRPLMKIYTKEITSKKIIGMTQCLIWWTHLRSYMVDSPEVSLSGTRSNKTLRAVEQRQPAHLPRQFQKF